MKISEKGLLLQKKFKQIRYTSLLLLFLGAASFAFFRNWKITIVFLVLDLILEAKFYRCPHCNKMLDCRKSIKDDTCCPKCEKFVFRGL